MPAPAHGVMGIVARCWGVAPATNRRCRPNRATLPRDRRCVEEPPTTHRNRALLLKLCIGFTVTSPCAELGRVSLPCRGFSGRVRSRESDAGVDR